MKNLLLMAIAFIGFSLTSNAETAETPKDYEISITTDHFDHCVVCIPQTVSENIGDQSYREGQYFTIHNREGYGDYSAESGHSTYSTISKQPNGNAYTSTLQSSYSYLAQSRKPNTSGLRVRRAKGSREDLSGNYRALQDYNTNTGSDHYRAEKGIAWLGKTISISRNSGSNWHFRSSHALLN